MRWIPAFLVAAVLAMQAVVAPAATAQPPPAPAVVHRPPVDAPIVDPFRPPPEPYAAGNRGLTYDTEPGTPVRASADGEVVFAGSVAWSLHVTVRHADGLRTSYSFLATVDVVVGERVRQGDPLGTAGEELHFGARVGDHYLDPASLFGSVGVTVEVELLPFEVPPGSTPDEERAALRWLTAGADGGGWFDVGLPGLDDLAAGLAGRARLLGHYLVEANPVVRTTRLAVDMARRLVSDEPCSSAPPPSRPAARGSTPRLAVLVGGLGSSSRSASIDELRTGELGYRDDAVVRFSYAGGRTPGTGGRFAGIPAHHYASEDTQGDLRAAARRLADLVVALAAARPDATVDVYAHSMGGVVTRLALWELVARGFDPARLGLVATLGSPHGGADLATAVLAAGLGRGGRAALAAAEEALGTGLDPSAPAIAQLAETSDVVDELRRRGVPAGVELVSVAASGDLVVAAPHTVVAGARHVVVGLAGREAHGDLVAARETTDELARALAGTPPACEDVTEVVGEVVAGHAVSYAQDLAGLTLTPVP